MSKPNHIKCLETQTVGKHKVDVYIESLPSKCCLIAEKEFSFKVDGSTIQQQCISPALMFRILSVVDNSLLRFIANNVVAKLEQQIVFSYRITIEAEGGTIEEINFKNKLYHQYLKRLQDKFNNKNDNICCFYNIGDNNHHNLIFSTL